MRLKLADFGLALPMTNSNYLSEDEAQHHRWCAPECLGIVFAQNLITLIHFNCFLNLQSQGNFDNHVNVWRFGVAVVLNTLLFF